MTKYNENAWTQFNLKNTSRYSLLSSLLFKIYSTVFLFCLCIRDNALSFRKLKV